jgi:DNA polymerase-3 subunit gamma/tau
MVLVRLAYAADLPTPDEALRALRESDGNVGESAGKTGGGEPGGNGTRMSVAAEGGARPSPLPRLDPAPRASVSAAPRLATFEDIVALARDKRAIQITHDLEKFVRPVSMQDGRLEISLTDGAPVGFANNLSAKLHEWTGKRWVVILSSQNGGQTIDERKRIVEDTRKEDARNHPLVQSVLQRFPGATIVDVRQRNESVAEPESEAAVFDRMPDMPPDPPDEEPRD